MAMLFDPSAPLPTAILAASSDTLDEKDVYDLAYFNVRNLLSGSPGVIAPAVFGGKLRRIYAYLDRDELHARNLSLMDVQRSLKKNNLMLPTGDVKIGDINYMVDMENMVHVIPEMNEIPVKIERDEFDPLGRPVFIGDVGHVEDTAAIQTNMVRISGPPTWESKRQVYIPIFRRPGANTIEVVEGVRERIPEFLDRLPVKEGAEDSGLKLDVVADQSVFVRSSINALVQEGVLGGILACVLVLVFIGSVRSTVVIALAIPLSALVAIVGLYFTGNTLNAMTLGGLALVMGRLIDDPIVAIENNIRHLDMGKSPRQAALDSATEVAVPVMVSTITTVAVFFPVVFMAGIGSYLFTPLAISVTFAMFASMFLARTLAPAYCAHLLRSRGEGGSRSRFVRLTDNFFDRLRRFYSGWLRRAIRLRWLVLTGSMLLFIGSLGLYPRIGQELFPVTDAGQITINMRAPSGTRIEKTEQITQKVEATIQRLIPAEDREMIVTDIGVLYDWPAGYTANAGAMDATILVQLTDAGKRHTSSQDYARALRSAFAREFPGVQFAFNTGGMVSAALNFGLPAPINIQVEGRDMQEQYRIAQEIRGLIEGKVPGAVDVRVQQAVDYPTIKIKPDRKKMAYLGVSMEDAVTNVMSVLNSSTTFDPAFWLDYFTGNHYFVGVTYEEEALESMDALHTAPITGDDSLAPVQLQNVADFEMGTSAVEVNHVSLARVIDVYANVDERDVGSVAADIERVLSSWGEDRDANGSVKAWAVPDPDEPGEALAGYTVRMRGEVSRMRESFGSMGFGLILASVLVYLIMVAQFRSFVDPFIIMFAVPLGIIGVMAILIATNTTLNVQSLMGVIFMVGVAVSNSILLVEFANRVRREQNLTPLEAAIASGGIRLRPILMTSITAIVALIPLALHEGEATMPLARAVIGGLTASTFLTIFVVPCLHVIIKGRRSAAIPRS